MNQSRFFVAVNTGDFETVKALLPHIDPASHDDLAFIRAASNNYVDIVALLLADGRVHPAARENLAFRMAAEKGYDEVIALLLTHEDVDPTAHENSAMRWSSTFGHANVVALLLADGRADPAAEFNTAIVWAASNQHMEVVALLYSDSRVRSTVYPDMDSSNRVERTVGTLIEWNVQAAKIVDKYMTKARHALFDAHLIQEMLQYYPMLDKQKFRE